MSKYRPADEEKQAGKVRQGDEEEMDPYEKSSPKPEEWEDLTPHRNAYRQNQNQKGAQNFRRTEPSDQQPWQKEHARHFFQKRRGNKKR